jgi:hypothetical protein
MTVEFTRCVSWAMKLGSVNRLQTLELDGLRMKLFGLLNTIYTLLNGMGLQSESH